PPTLPEFGRKGVHNNDPLFFSSVSSSSDFSFEWHSEAKVVKPKPSCFGPLKRLKHIKTSVSLRSTMKKKNEVQMFDDDQIHKNDHSGFSSSDDDSLYKENIEYVEASPYDSELVSLEAAEIVISKFEEIKDDNLRKKLLNVHLLIANIEAL
nr:protein BIG GRAIN 1-like A [Tanacetum cinerariifolium]